MKNSENIDPVLGALVPDSDWRPSIAHLLRRSALLEIFGRLPVGRILEIGCGASRILPDLAGLGFTGKALDSSELAQQESRACIDHFGLPFLLADSIDKTDKNNYDVVMALEVLEHIKDDEAAIKEWSACLNENGLLIISVPAFQRKFGATDIWAGHFRRYEMDDLQSLLSRVGLELVDYRCIGFPLNNFSSLIGKFLARRKNKQRENMSKQEATALSGVDRTTENQSFALLNNVVAKLILRLFMQIQWLTSQRHWGVGWIVVAKRRPVS